MRSFHVYHFICGHLSLLKVVPPETRNLGHLEKNFICIQKAKHSIHLVIERDIFALTYSKNCTFIKCEFDWLGASFPAYEIGHFMPNSACIDYVQKTCKTHKMHLKISVVAFFAFSQTHTSAKLIEIKLLYLQIRHGLHESGG